MRFPARPPAVWTALADPVNLQKIIPHVAPVLPDGRYLHWDDLRKRPPPAGLTSEEWWAAQKLARRSARVEIPELTDEGGRPFWFTRLNAIDRATHELDRRGAAREVIEALGDDPVREEYRLDQLIEEAINSSLIEGAKLTTRALAKAGIRDGRRPTSRGERMVVNNYNAMVRLLDIADRALTLDDLLEIHAILGADALDVPSSEGRLRTDADNVRVEDAATGDVWFTPPPASELGHRLNSLVAFANGDADGPFLHPLLRAITLHFWMAYLHPFVDGNGRMARALFYWQMLRAKYDFAQYLSISGPIDRSRRSYYRSFVHTETDEGDLTYFLVHQLRVLDGATKDLLAHLRERTESLQRLSRALSRATALNHRQQAVLSHVVRTSHIGVTVSGHAKSHRVSYLTARKDLQELEKARLLQRIRSGREDRYFPTDELAKRFASRD
jgi:Fic family protein